MDTTDRDLKKASDIEQKALIGKMHKMQWLKSNSQLSGHKKIHPGKELTFGVPDSTINEGTEEKSEVVSANICSNSAELSKIDPVRDKSVNEDDSILNKEPAELSLNTGECSGSMDTVWNKDMNPTDTLFPSPQTLAVERMDEKQVIGVSEDMVTGQLEQFRLEEKENKSDKLDHEAENDWNHLNVSELSKSDNNINNQMNPKQCHDNNNNNAKSKSQSPLEAKKSVQKTTTKVNTNRRISDPKIKKPTAVTGNSFKECNSPLKQGSRSKDDSSSNDDGITSTDSKKLSVGTTPKSSDKKVNGCNKNLTIAKETRTKEQQFSRQHFPTLNDTPNKGRPPIERDDKAKCSTPSVTKLKPMRSESDKRSSEAVDESKRCHKVQVTRTQSYTVQYHRNKPVIKPQQRYLRNTAKPEEDASVQNSPGFNNNVPTENAPRKKFESQQSSINKQVSDPQSNQNTLGKNARSSNEYNLSDRGLAKISSAPCKRSYQNLSTVKTSTDRNFKDDQASYQKFKKDSNVYRRSSSNFQMGKDERSDEQKRNADNNVTKDYGANRLSMGDPKARSQPDGSRLTVYPHRTSNGASNTNKTDTLESIAVNNVQSAKSLNISNSTKDSTIKNTPQESQVLRSSCNETEVQFLKTEQEDTSNNNMNDKTSGSSPETKSVKFSDNIQEITVSMHHPGTLYSNSAIHQSKLPANTLYPDIQTSAQQIENHQSVQNKTYFDDNNAQYNKNCTDVQSIERDLHMLNLAQQKSDQNPQIASSQSVLPPNSCSSVIDNTLNYPNLPAMYLNQYSNAQTVPRKTADSTIVSQSTLIPSTCSYAADTQSMMQTDPSSLLMHTTQTSVLPQSGFHNHSLTTQPNQWNLPLTDMYLIGNMMNPALPLQNSRHACNADFSNMQQPGYVHPMFYVPPLCMQSWNPLLHYPAPLFQNTPYTNTFSNQVLPANNLTDYMNCGPSSSMQNIPYKPYQQMQSLENPPNFTVPMKLDNYVGNVQGCKSNNRMKDNNNGDYQMRASQYRVPVPNEYQNCSQDGQLSPFSYTVLDSIARNNVPTSVHVNQKYSPCTTANYSRMPDMYHGNRDAGSGRQDDSECVQPMISPKDVMNMNYGINYSRKTDIVQNSPGRTDKPAAQMHFANAHHYAPHYQKNAAYQQTSPKEVPSRMNFGRGMRKMDQ